ncbi:MAG: hypothetical protein IPJ18_22705 [Betaproteobacteria bacterium]|nr:hypothetical protein [Betaproteobacteria bacterium]
MALREGLKALQLLDQLLKLGFPHLTSVHLRQGSHLAHGVQGETAVQLCGVPLGDQLPWAASRASRRAKPESKV